MEDPTLAEDSLLINTDKVFDVTAESSSGMKEEDIIIELPKESTAEESKYDPDVEVEETEGGNAVGRLYVTKLSYQF